MQADDQKSGVEKILPIGQIDDAEKELLAAAVKELGPSIEKVRQSPTEDAESVAN
jgi:malate/lactate dehydrogenase